MTHRLVPLADAPFGAEIELDLDRPPPGVALREALARHQLLVVRGGCTAEQQLELCARLGRVLPQGPRVVVNEVPAQPQPETIWISNRVDDGRLHNHALAPHHEFAYLPDPLEGLALYAEEVVEGHAVTRFVSGLTAHRQLDEPLRARLDRLQALFVANFDFAVRERTGRHRDLEVDPRYPRAVHPVVVPHPMTGDAILYVNACQTDRILGLSADESEALLQELFAVLRGAENTYDHVYRPGDLVLWDNLALQHGRDAFDPAHPRTLRRITWGARAPWEAWPSPSCTTPSGGHHDP